MRTEILETPDSLGLVVARDILARLRATGPGRTFLLGCPSGRSPRPVYRALARLLAEHPADLSRFIIVMMDEFLVATPDGALAWIDPGAAHSCRRFAHDEIAGLLNRGLPEGLRVPDANVWLPDPRAPEQYDARIEAAGGIDLFILASGGGDGHVAFNPPGSPRHSRTRIVELAERTRLDNMRTFPTLRTLEQVPLHGVSVGIATIAELSRAVAMVVWGEEKRLAFDRIAASADYAPSWPATVVAACRDATVYADWAAAGE